MTKDRIAALLLLAAAACAGAGAGVRRGERVAQADARLPALGALAEEPDRQAYKDALEHARRADGAREAGKLDEARAGWAAAADGLVAVAQRPGAAEHRLPFLQAAADLYLQSQQWEKAAGAAERVASDEGANEISKAMGWHVAAHSWLNVASAAAKSGKLDPLRLTYADQSGSRPLSPRPPPGAWRSFVAAADAYLGSMDADPELKRPAGERRLLSPAGLALVAAEVHYTFDDMEEARRRLESILQRFPEGEVLADAAPLYLQTFLFAGDAQGFQAALDRTKAIVEAVAGKAATQESKDACARATEAIGRTETSTRFAQAEKLLLAGKLAEAAQAFEAIASAGGPGADVPGALHNAAVAWDKAEQPARAAALRERILKEFTDAKVAPSNALLVAAYQATRGDHAGAARRYGEYLQRWPDGPSRCIALRNVAIELEAARKPADAGEAYFAFAREEACTGADPELAARALHLAGKLFEAAQKPARAEEAYAAATKLERAGGAKSAAGGERPGKGE